MKGLPRGVSNILKRRGKPKPTASKDGEPQKKRQPRNAKGLGMQPSETTVAVPGGVQQVEIPRPLQRPPPDCSDSSSQSGTISSRPGSPSLQSSYSLSDASPSSVLADSEGSPLTGMAHLPGSENVGTPSIDAEAQRILNRENKETRWSNWKDIAIPSMVHPYLALLARTESRHHSARISLPCTCRQRVRNRSIVCVHLESKCAFFVLLFCI